MKIKPNCLDAESRVTILTNEAAHHLCRKPQTLRFWASRKTGPIQPSRSQGRLHWPVEQIRRLLGFSGGDQ